MNPKLAIAFGKAVIKDSDDIIKNILAILAKNECFGQVASNKAIVSKKQVLQAVEQTLSAFTNGTNFAKREEIELLLRLSGRKQLPKALEILGVKNGRQEVAVIAIGENAEKAVAEIKEFLKLKEQKLKTDFKELKKAFEIGKKEERLLKNKEKSFENLVLEKISLIALED